MCAVGSIFPCLFVLWKLAKKQPGLLSMHQQRKKAIKKIIHLHPILYESGDCL